MSLACSTPPERSDRRLKLAELAREVAVCRNCDLARSRCHALPGEGDICARMMLIALSPGEVEDREGRMFLGPSGAVLDHLLALAGIERGGLYMTNLIKCRLPRNRKPKQREIIACHPFLDREIDIVRPEFLVPLGHFATRYLLEKYRQAVPDRHSFRNLYGRLRFIGSRKVYPVQHPAAVLHTPEMMDVLEANYRRLTTFTVPCRWYPVCPMKRYHEQERLDRRWIALYCHGDWQSCVRYQGEETHRPLPDRMLPDGTMAPELENS
ncbi:MAG: uracil-DNA glycosylase [Deltaproteobacteria bacterium]|nr:uracil-DNA glycosylase [Candidatus Anaeroferrophillacea bacterium]